MAAYEFIKPGHSFFPHIEILRAAIASDPHAASASERSLLRIDFDQSRPELKWAYVSKQTCAGSFQAATFLFRAKRNRVQRYVFPRDPKLQGLGTVLNEFPQQSRVLRYVPRRRLTVNTGDSIAKFVRPTELLEVVARLKQVQAIVKGDAFSIPRLIKSRAQDGFFFEELVAGKGIDALLNRATSSSLLEAAGALAYRIHQHDPIGLPRIETTSTLNVARKDEALLTLFRPDLKVWLAEVVRELVAALANFEVETTFCHGDLRAPHLLSRPDGNWSIVDFDGAAAADPHWEQALFLTSLKRECPIFLEADLHEQAVDAFIRGYEREGGRVNAEKLRWFRLASEIHFLARTFQRDLLTPELFAQSVCAIARLSKVGQP
jgi:aminoglycoside phosphotransferase (APT) family kinase protein